MEYIINLPKIAWYIDCIVCEAPLIEEPPEKIREFIVGNVGEQIPVYSHLNRACNDKARQKIREKSEKQNIPIVEIPHLKVRED